MAYFRSDKSLSILI